MGSRRKDASVHTPTKAGVYLRKKDCKLRLDVILLGPQMTNWSTRQWREMLSEIVTSLALQTVIKPLLSLWTQTDTHLRLCQSHNVYHQGTHTTHSGQAIGG